jgi:putative transposase
MLSDKIKHYNDTEQYLKVSVKHYKDEFEWLREVDSIALSRAQQNLEKAYTNFFKFRNKGYGFPSFKKKRQGRSSYTTGCVNGNIVLADGYLKLPKLGRVKIKQHRSIPDNFQLKSVTVSKTASGKYYASILYKYEADITPVVPENIIGINFSLERMYTTSEGESPEYTGYYSKLQKKIAKEQRKLSKRQKDGKNREKQRIKLARLHEKVANQRSDFLHKQSRQIANAYDAVYIEDLNVKDIAETLDSGKDISDIGWNMFNRMLQYKLEEQGKQLIKTDKGLSPSMSPVANTDLCAAMT